MEAVRELSDLLKNSFYQESESEGVPHGGSLLDPSTMVLVGRALQTIPNTRVTKVAEVQKMMQEVAAWLDESVASASHAEVLRDFCLALARGASSHHRDFRDERPTHPYRR